MGLAKKQMKSTNDSIHDCWCDDMDAYDSIIGNKMTHSWFVDLNSNIKINKNCHEIKQGEDDHDQCVKYRLVWDVLVHIKNVIVQLASIDLKIDETNWSIMSFRGLIHYCIAGNM